MGNSTSNHYPYDTTRVLAEKLASRDKPVLLALLSPSCGLCKSLQPDLEQAEAAGTVQVARLNSLDSSSWAPELLAYDIEAVPCFVLLDKRGRALGKSTAPHSRSQMQAALQAMLHKADR